MHIAEGFRTVFFDSFAKPSRGDTRAVSSRRHNRFHDAEIDRAEKLTARHRLITIASLAVVSWVAFAGLALLLQR